MRALSARAFVQRFVTALIVSVVVTALVIAAAYAQAARKVAAVPKVLIDPSVLEPGNNFLLIGSDSRAFVDTAQEAQNFGTARQQGGQRSDTIMVAHVDSGTGTALLVSFPRDLWVDIPGIGHAKINAAFNAGPQRVIETIERDFDVPITHYLQIDFAGFRKIVNAIGSVPIFFPTPARDVKSGLYVNHAGCVHLNGDQALAYVRSRYYQSLSNGQWRYDPTSDLGRIRRQQYFLRTLAQQALHAAVSAPWRASGLADAMLSNLQRDPNLGFSAMRSLAYAFHRPGGVESVTLPTHRQFENGQDALALDSAQAAPLLARLRGAGDSTGSGGGGGGSTATTVTPKSVRLSVQNGSGRDGLGASAVTALRGAGFAVAAKATNADRSTYDVTEVRYAPDAKPKAQLVLGALGGAGRIVPLSAGQSAAGGDIVLVLGRDFHGIRRPAAPAPTTASQPSSTAPATVAPTAALPAVGC